MSPEYQVQLQRHTDERGALISLEAQRNVPFDIKRVYFIYATEQGASRGFHAHKSLRQLITCVSGSCRFILDDGRQRQTTWLDDPTKGLLLNGPVWREMHDFSPDCVLLVLADQHYDQADYIRDYDSFRHYVNAP